MHDTHRFNFGNALKERLRKIAAERISVPQDGLSSIAHSLRMDQRQQKALYQAFLQELIDVAKGELAMQMVAGSK